jgi:hypothetical protein
MIRAILRLGALLIAVAAACVASAGSVRTIAGDIHNGNVTIGPGGVLTVTATLGGATTQIDADQVLLAVFRDETRAATPETRGALLVDGSFAAGKVTSERDAGSYRIEGPRNLKIPADRVARLVFRQIPAPRSTGTKTGVLLANGDFAAGAVSRLEKDRVEITSLLFGPQSFRIPDEAAGVVLAPVAPAPAAYEIASADGSVFRVAAFHVDNDQVVVETALLGKVRIPVADLDRIRAGDGRFRAIPLLEPQAVHGVAGVDVKKAFRAVTSAADPAPPVLGRRADNALVLGAGASATYAVPEGMNFLAAEVAVPDDAPPGTRITFVVAADGRVVQRSAAVPAGIRPTPMKISLGPARSLVLYCETVGATAPGATGVWMEPVLLKR